MANIIKPKYSNTASAVPTTSNLADEEFATNTADKKIFQRVSSNIITIADQTENAIHAATSKTTPVDNDELALIDSAASNVLKRLLWSNLKAAIKSYYDSVTATLTNKRITPRTGSTTSSATPTINTDNVDMYLLTAQAVDITSFTTNLSGTPTEGQKLWIVIVGTSARAITWGASFESSTVTLPTTTVSTNRLDVGFVWNSVTSKWRCVATA
jgi:hypothetical protein